MNARTSSSRFTKSPADAEPFGPPLIGALLRQPWETVQQRMLERLHERGFDDLDTAHLSVFQYPGPQGARPSELAARLRISKQALNYLLGELERLGYVGQRRQVELVPHDLLAADLFPPRDAALHARDRHEALGAAEHVPSPPDEAVGEVESTWANQLGPERFAELRSLLLELNPAAAAGDPEDPRPERAGRARARDSRPSS